MKIFNIIFFVLLVFFICFQQHSKLPISGFYLRSEKVFIKNEQPLQIETKVNFLQAADKYTSITNISDLENQLNHGGFFINGDIYKDKDRLIAITENIKEINDTEPYFVYVASSSPIVSKIQKSMLGVNVKEKRIYETWFINSRIFCYKDLNNNFIKCLRPQSELSI